jgi:hypothetical protein
LLSQEAQQVVTDAESAYYQFLKSVMPPQGIDLLTMYEPQILSDIELVLSNKTHLIETLMREYDLLHHYEL